MLQFEPEVRRLLVRERVDGLARAYGHAPASVPRRGAAAAVARFVRRRSGAHGVPAYRAR